MDNYGGSADQLVIMQIVTYNWGPTVDQLWAGQLHNCGRYNTEGWENTKIWGYKGN